MYPKRLHPRRRPLVRHPGARPRRQRLGRHLPHRAGRRCRMPGATFAPSRGCRAAGVAALPPALRHPALARRRQGHQRRRGRPDRRRPALRRPRRLLDPRPGEPAGHRAARPRRGLRPPPRHGWRRASGRRGRVTRRDLLLHVAELERWERGGGAPPRGSRRLAIPSIPPSREVAGEQVDVRERAAAQSQAAREVVPAAEQPTQLTLDLGDRPRLTAGAGLPEMTGPERVRAELDVLGLDVSAHVVEFYGPLLAALGVTRSRDLLAARSRSEVWVAGVKVATQTPPVRSGRRVVFLTLDDSTGPSDCTFFEDVQGPYAGIVFHSWLLLVRGIAAPHRRPRGLDPGDRGLGARRPLGRLAARRPRPVPGPRSPPARRTPWPGPRRPSRRARSATPAPAAGCSSTPRASSSRPTPTSSPPAPTRARARGAPGAVPCPQAPAAGAALAQAVARQPRQLRTLGWSTTTAPGTVATAASPKETRRGRRAEPTPPCGRPPRAAHGRRAGGARHPHGRAAAPSSAARCASSTSGAAPAAPPSRSPRPATTSPSSTPAPTPWPRCAAGPPRPAPRSASHAVQGDADTIGEPAPAGERPAYDLVCLPRHPRGRRRPRHRAGQRRRRPRSRRHPLARRRPAPRRPSSRGPGRRVRPGPGDPRAARRALGRRRPRRRGGSTSRRCASCSPRTASPRTTSHGVRIFSDLVPSALVDSEADRAALLELEEVAGSPPRPPAARRPRQRPARPRDAGTDAVRGHR